MKGQPRGLPFYMGSVVLDYECDWPVGAVLLFTEELPVVLLRTIMEYRRN